MKIISLWAPWAHLWAGGKKRIETRGKNWMAPYPLPLWLAVHAAKRLEKPERELCAQEPFRSALAALGYASADDLPLGCVVGVVRVVRAYQFSPGDVPPSPECSFGDYAPGRWGFQTDRNLVFQRPIPVKGFQGVWEWTRPEDVPLLDAGDGLPAKMQPENRPTAGQGSLFGATTEGWPR